MGLFSDEINYNDYKTSVIKDNKQINNDIVIADKTNYNYTFDSQTPIESVINQLPGYVAKVTYFNKSSGNQEVYEYPDLTLDDIIVEYTKINNLNLYMDSAVDATSLKNYEGEGYIVAGLEPKPGDFILMPLYDKRLGLFVVTTTGAVTYNFTRIFKINFKFYMFPDKEDLTKIYRNVNKKLVADNTLNNTGVEILYDIDRYTVIRRIVELIPMYTSIWKEKILTIDNNFTVSYYSKDLKTYVGDINMEHFIINLFGITDIKKINLFNTDKNKQLTILDILINKDKGRWGIQTNYKTAFIYDTLRDPFLKDYMYNQIDYFVETNTDNKNDYYILSKGFYDAILTNNEDIELKDNLELGLMNMIEGEDIDLNTFNKIIDELDSVIRSNDNKEIFYRVPLTIIVMKYFKYKHNYPDKFLY